MLALLFAVAVRFGESMCAGARVRAFELWPVRVQWLVRVTFNVRLAALRSGCEYWRKQGWLVGDPLSRLVSRAVPPDHSRALTREEVTTVLGLVAPLRERVLWHMLYETAARAKELLVLDIPDLDIPNRWPPRSARAVRPTSWPGRPAPPGCCHVC